RLRPAGGAPGVELGRGEIRAVARPSLLPSRKGRSMTTLVRRGLVTAAAFAVLLTSCSTTHAGKGAEQGLVQAQQQGPPPEASTDPDDVNLPLDLKTLTQASTASTITYTVETYEPFKDDQADFSWGIDKNNDGVVDDYVSVEFESKKL